MCKRELCTIIYSFIHSMTTTETTKMNLRNEIEYTNIYIYTLYADVKVIKVIISVMVLAIFQNSMQFITSVGGTFNTFKYTNVYNIYIYIWYIVYVQGGQTAAREPHANTF